MEKVWIILIALNFLLVAFFIQWRLAKRSLKKASEKELILQSELATMLETLNRKDKPIIFNLEDMLTVLMLDEQAGLERSGNLESWTGGIDENNVSSGIDFYQKQTRALRRLSVALAQERSLMGKPNKNLVHSNFTEKN